MIFTIKCFLDSFNLIKVSSFQFMKIFHRASVGFLAVAFLFGLIGPMPVFAATAPSLGAAESYAAFGKAGVTNDSNVGTTHLWGNVGADASVTNMNDVTQVDGSIVIPAPGVQTAASTAYDALDAQGVTGSLDLAGNNTVTPGVYTVGATELNGTLTLNGAGVYIFRSSSSISTSGPAVVSLTNGATACNVFWQIPTSMTMGAGTQMKGTIIAQTGLISFAAGATLQGRALSLVSQVTLDSNQITEPTCAAAQAAAGSGTANVNVVKVVINDNGRTKKVSDFPLFMDGGSVVSGQTYNFPIPTNGHVFTVTETSDTNYTRTFSGDCTSDGKMNVNPGDNRFCVVTNNDIGAPIVVPPVPPLIDVVKVPSPLALPNGPGSVMYTYTLKNIGTVPVTNVTMVGDTCSPIVRISGDVNNDNKLDLTETWAHTCTTTLTSTHTNNVVATGWANGLSATDIASATVIVGVPAVVPPLIHVTKVPNPLALAAGGGIVTYTEKITNPGTIPLSNVQLVDDKCAPMQFISGDINGNNLLEPTETWAYTCQSNLKTTTTNTAIASGQANGITVRDFAIATVVVAEAAPILPVTGFFSAEKTPWVFAILSSVFAAAVLLYTIRNKKNI